MPSEVWSELRLLISRAQSGDREAFGRIVQTFETRLRRFVGAQVGNHLQHRLDGDDLTQETFVRALQLIDRFEWQSDEAFWGWLTSIARIVVDRSVRKLRTKSRDVSREVRIEVEEVVAEGVSPSRMIRRDERFERLKRALDTLSPVHRKAIFLAHIRGLPTREIAERLGRSPNATSMILLRAYKKLRTGIGETASYGLADHHRLGESEETEAD